MTQNWTMKKSISMQSFFDTGHLVAWCPMNPRTANTGVIQPGRLVLDFSIRLLTRNALLKWTLSNMGT